MAKNYAVIESDIVTNVIVADSLKIAKDVTGKDCVECDGSFWIGWTRVDGQWVAPVIEEVLEGTEPVYYAGPVEPELEEVIEV
jgi:hypothetical protein